jgi:hypothetical protein
MENIIQRGRLPTAFAFTIVGFYVCALLLLTIQIASPSWQSWAVITLGAGAHLILVGLAYVLTASKPFKNALTMFLLLLASLQCGHVLLATPNGFMLYRCLALTAFLAAAAYSGPVEDWWRAYAPFTALYLAVPLPLLQWSWELHLWASAPLLVGGLVVSIINSSAHAVSADDSTDNSNGSNGSKVSPGSPPDPAAIQGAQSTQSVGEQAAAKVPLRTRVRPPLQRLHLNRPVLPTVFLLPPSATDAEVAQWLGQNQNVEIPITRLMIRFWREKRKIYDRAPRVSVLFEGPKGFGEDATVTVHVPRLLNLLNDLLLTAIDSVAGEGLIRIHVRPGLHRVLIIIEDNGHGLGEEELLIRLGPKGLANARELLKTWGGRLDILSRLGVGTRAILDLPRSDIRRIVPHTSPTLESQTSISV